MPQSLAASSQSFNRFTQCLLIVCATGLLLTYCSVLVSTPALDWNAARIYPAFLLAGGISPYAAAGSGAATGWIYGPVMPILHLPATLAPTITSAMLVSAVINLLALVGPMVVVTNDAAHRIGATSSEKTVLLLTLFGLIPVLPILSNYLLWIHCDQVVIGLSLLSSWFLARALAGKERANSTCAAVLAILAVWTKQIAVMIPLAQLFYLAIFKQDWPWLGRHLIRLLTAGVAISGCMIFIFGVGPLVFNLGIVPAGHSLKGWAYFINYAGVFATQAAPCLVLTAGLGFLARRNAPLPDLTFNKNLLKILLITAVMETPLNLLAACKVGGNTNSFHALPLFFMAVPVALITTIDWWRRHLSQVQLRLAASAIALTGAALLLAKVPFRLTPAPHLEAARIVAEQHPGEVYFPQNPLIIWWTERKSQHFEYGLIDQAVAGYPVTKARYFAYLPPHVRLVVYPHGFTGLSLQAIAGLQRIDSIGIYDFYAKSAARP